MLKHKKNKEEIDYNINRFKSALEVEASTMAVLEEKITSLQRQRNVLNKTISNTEAMLAFWEGVGHEADKGHFINSWTCDLGELAKLAGEDKRKFVRAVHDAVASMEEADLVHLTYDPFNPFSADPIPAAISTKGVFFNGCSLSGCTQFRLNMDRTNVSEEQTGLENASVITNGKPYELAVVGVLLLAEKMFPQVYKVKVNPQLIERAREHSEYL